jgi:hypothetical protein
VRPEDQYAEWLDRLAEASHAKRIDEIENFLGRFAEKSSEAERLVEAAIDPKEFEKPIILPYLDYTSAAQQPKSTLSHVRFPSLTIALKHRRLPMILVMTEKLSKRRFHVPIEKIKKAFGVVQALSYTKTLSKMTTNEKSKLRELILEGIRSYRKENRKNTLWLSDYLESGKDFSFRGFAANLPYINVNPKFGDTQSFWIHAWGTPQLLFSHARLPVMMIVGPSVRLDENVLGESNMVGFTG